MLYQRIASVANIAKWVSLGIVALGEKIQMWQSLNMEPPSAYTWAKDHKVLACFSLFFIGNSVEGGLVQTGAFEVELNGMPIWSKLKSGRIPQGSELFDIINNQLRLSKSEFTQQQFDDFNSNPPPPPVSQQPEHVDEIDQQREPTVENDFDEFDNAERDEF